MKKKKNSSIIIFIVIALVVFGGTFAAILITNNIKDSGKTQSAISEEEATNIMNKLHKKIRVRDLDLIRDSVDLETADINQALPEINKYPEQVKNTTENYIEIFSSTEKATVTGKANDNDRWLVDVAEKFNKQGFEVNGKKASVRIRGIASGLGMDYITSGKYVPDAFTPSNKLWGDILSQMGIKTTLVEEKLAGNVAGIVLSKSKHQQIIDKYGEVNLENIITAVTNNEIMMGYTNPFSSSTGANFLISTLYQFDVNNPLSETAVSAFQGFQSNIPFVAYTTLQMQDSAASGVLDGFVFESQQFENTPELKGNYVFTPFGVRHDSPVYEIGDISSEKKEILKRFIDFCKTEENQQLATKYGFNKYNDYTVKNSEINGSLLSQAQKIWKENKAGSRDIIAVFVADTSGSMDGEPMNRLKESLLSGSKFIGNDSSVGLVTFSDDVDIALPIGKFDIGHRSYFAGAVKNMTAQGGTAMYDGIIVAEKMLAEARADNPDAKCMIFVLSDGEPNTGAKFNDAQKMMQGFKVPIYTIGYNANIDVLTTIASINEAANINADTDDVVYKIQSLFNAEM